MSYIDDMNLSMLLDYHLEKKQSRTNATLHALARAQAECKGNQFSGLFFGQAVTMMY